MNKITISITGHRDLYKKDIKKYKLQIKEFIKEIQIQKREPLMILTPLADGADRLIVYVAMEMGLDYSVVLPMDRELYIKDFSQSSLMEFDYLISKSLAIEIMPLYWDNTLKSIQKYGIDRDYQYSEMGRVLAKTSDYMIALWDRIDNQKWGGTAHIVDMRLNQYKKSIFIIDVLRDNSLLYK